MATIRVTGTTLQIDEAFYPEGIHPIDDAHLPRLKGLAGVEIVQDNPIKNISPRVSSLPAAESISEAADPNKVKE